MPFNFDLFGPNRNQFSGNLNNPGNPLAGAPGNFQLKARYPDLFDGINLPQDVQTEDPGLNESMDNPVLPGTEMSGYSDFVAPGLQSWSSDPTTDPRLQFVGPQNQSVISRLMGGDGSNLANMASLLGAFSQGEKSNRLIKGNLTQNYDRLMADAQTLRNRNESDAMAKLGMTGYIKSGGAQYKPPTIQLGGQMRTAPTFSFAPRNPSAEQVQGANTLEAQLLERLKPGGSYTPTPLDSYANPSLGENIGSYGALAAGGLGGLQNAGGGTTAQDVIGAIGKGVGLAKQIPWSKIFGYFSGGGDSGE